MEVLPENGERFLESLLVSETWSGLFPGFVIVLAFIIGLGKEMCAREVTKGKERCH